jgi:hypothetical protein
MFSDCIYIISRDHESEPYRGNGGSWTNYQDTTQYRLNQNAGR